MCRVLRTLTLGAKLTERLALGLSCLAGALVTVAVSDSNRMGDTVREVIIVRGHMVIYFGLDLDLDAFCFYEKMLCRNERAKW